MSRLVIGVGNPDRGDDAAGLMVTRGLTQVRTKEVSDCSELIDLWDGEKDVVVVDAMRSRSAPGTVARFDAIRDTLPSKAFTSTHVFGVTETVELARALGRLPDRLVVYGIEASNLGHGHETTAAVRDAVAAVIEAIEAG